MRTATVIVAMSVDAVQDKSALEELAHVTGASVAFLQLGEPTLVAELDRLAASGVRSVRLVRLPGGVLTPARSWLRRVAAHWVREHPQTQVEVVDSKVTGREAPLESAAWDDIPGHRHHVLVCRGPRCSAKGSEKTAHALTLALYERGLSDDDVLVAQTGCLFPCNHAPVVVVHPADAWYGPVTPERVEEIVDGHLIGGRIVDGLHRPRDLGHHTG